MKTCPACNGGGSRPVHNAARRGHGFRLRLCSTCGGHGEVEDDYEPTDEDGDLFQLIEEGDTGDDSR